MALSYNRDKREPIGEVFILRKITPLLLALLAWGCCAAPVLGAADFEFRGTIEPTDDTARLLAYYVNRFNPEELELTVVGQPDATGRFHDLYMDLTGVNVEGVRIDKLTFRMNDVQFNAPEDWASGDVECRNALQVYAVCRILEEDINKGLEAKTFGKDDHWKNISLAITPNGLSGRGVYLAKLFFIPLNILIEIDSKLKIVNRRELWLDNPQVRINKMDLPEYVTQKALSQIQPLLDLDRVPLPMRLHTVTLEKGAAHLSTRLLPEPIERGATYHYLAH